MAKIFIAVGHGGSDPGAVANGLKESDMALATALKCKSELERHGVQVKMSRTKDENDPLTDEIKECNAYNPDVAIAIHYNAGGGDGFEYWYSIFQNQTGGKDKRIGELIETEVKAIGQNSRGGKTKKDATTGRDYFGFIRELAAPSVILEGCFIDSNDRLAFDEKHEQEAIGVAYAKGVLKYFGISYKAPTQPTPGSSAEAKMYRVVTGSFSSKANADKRVSDLKTKGFDSFIDVYTK